MKIYKDAVEKPFCCPRKEQENVKDVLCDKCGKSCLDSEEMNFEYAEVKAHWGYASKKDLEHHVAHLCEPCYDAVVTAGLKPVITHYM